MAILFSKATLTSGDSSTTFLISGAPSSSDDFEGWTAYHEFVRSIPADSEVQAKILAYTYGERDIVVATPEEVAYMAMRLRMRPDFLESRCKLYDVKDFRFNLD